MDEDQKKIELPEIIIFLLLNGGADLFDVMVGLAAGVPVVGQVGLFMAPPVGFSVWATTQFWLIMKGGIGFRKQATYLAGGILDVVPLLNILPARTVTLIITIYLVNHPQVAQVAGAAQARLRGRAQGRTPGAVGAQGEKAGAAKPAARTAEEDLPKAA